MILASIAIIVTTASGLIVLAHFLRVALHRLEARKRKGPSHGKDIH
ncbi:hypothetical protein [Oceaniglobus trochenteri]|nr:hypothetical protein [Oceaniglobus trochenteri]